VRILGFMVTVACLVGCGTGPKPDGQPQLTLYQEDFRVVRAVLENVVQPEIRRQEVKGDVLVDLQTLTVPIVGEPSRPAPPPRRLSWWEWPDPPVPPSVLLDPPILPSPPGPPPYHVRLHPDRLSSAELVAWRQANAAARQIPEVGIPGFAVGPAPQRPFVRPTVRLSPPAYGSATSAVLCVDYLGVRSGQTWFVRLAKRRGAWRVAQSEVIGYIN
jgi:hypothetical protein